MRLRQCFCGGTPKHYPKDFPYADTVELSHIECEKCGYSTVSYWNGNRAMQNWNFLQRTKKTKESEAK